MRFTSLAVELFALVTSVTGYEYPLSPALQQILDKASSPPYDYPTSLTNSILPKPLHSHNDYWRPVPFYTALSYGAISVEADVWFIDNELYVGHELAALSKDRTFDRLYVQPILSVLKAQNPTTDFSDGDTSKNGVFDMASTVPLFLWVDVKTDGHTTWPAVVDALGPLRERGYLTNYTGEAVQRGPVFVIGTGNTPRNAVEGIAPRDYFWDGPLGNLTGVTYSLSPIASADFEEVVGTVKGLTLGDKQLEVLRRQVKDAHGKGIGVRYWGLPGWPIGTRNAVWRTLYEEGVDLLSVDDLEGGAGFWEGIG